MRLPWKRYTSFFTWLRYGLIVRWRCAICKKRHLSSERYWGAHIDFDVPLCTNCQDAMFSDYNQHMLRLELEDQARDLCGQYEGAWSFRDWQTIELIEERLSHHFDLREAFERVCSEDDGEEDEWILG